ncbi:MAG: phosphatase PAP2 family protein [Acidobacteriota bacterium]
MVVKEEGETGRPGGGETANFQTPLQEPVQATTREPLQTSTQNRTLSVGQDGASGAKQKLPEGAVYDGRLTPADKVFIAYLLILAGLILLAIERIEHWAMLLLLHALSLGFIVLLAKVIAPKLGNVGRFIRGWYAVPFIPTTFKELEYLIPRLHPRDFDWQLAAIDYRVFGVHPTIWLERLHVPLLTEIFQIVYATYYFYPVILGVVLWLRGDFERFHFWVFILMCGFYLSYLGYIAVPAIGPRFILADQQSLPLSGVWLFDTIRGTLDRAEGITRDCFPSGHTEITLLVLFYAWKFHRRTFQWMWLPLFAIIVSTVYLRYHYVVDVVAGVVAALLVIAAAKPMYRWLGGGEIETTD